MMPRIMYGIMTRCINSLSMAFFVASSSAPDSINAKSSLSFAFRIRAANMSGEIIPATLLQIPMMLIRRAALSIGPIMVT